MVVEEHLIDCSPEWNRDIETGELKGSRGVGRPIMIGTPDETSTRIGNWMERRELGNPRWTNTRYGNSAKSALERNLQLARQEIQRICAQLHLTRHIETEAQRIYYQCAYRGLARGRKIETLVAGVLYFVAKQSGVARTIDEFREVSGLDKKEIGRVYRHVVRELKLSVTQSSPYDYLSRFANALKLSPKVQTLAVKILEKSEELTSGRGPTGMAAAALYIAALQYGEKRTQREVADVAGVTEVTIRNRYKELLKNLKIDSKKLIKKKIK